MSKVYTILDVVSNDFCTGCGLCVSESKGALKMDWDEKGFIKPIQISKFQDNDAIKVCPFNPNPDKEVEDEDKLANIYFKEAKQKDPQIGNFENTYLGYSKEYRESSSSGGIATYVFGKLLEDKVVDHLYVVKEINGSYEYQLFSDFSQIKQISKTRYLPVTLENLFIEIGSIEGKVAVSGVACFVKAIRLKQYYNKEWKEKIPFVIGIICGGLKSRFFSDYLAQKSGIEGEYFKQQYRIKDPNSLALDYSFGAFGKNSDYHEIKMKKVGDMWGTGLFKNNACDFCTDVTTELADISLGDAWLNEYRNDGLGNSIIITRTKLADEIIRRGIENKDLEVSSTGFNKIIESQKGSFTHRQDTLKFRINTLFFKRRTVPKQRNRFYKNSSLSLNFVQICRRITRERSTSIWGKHENSLVFDAKMKKYLYLLKFATKVNHKLRRE